MAAKRKNKLGITTYILIAVIIVVILALCGVFKRACVEKIDIEYGPGAQLRAQQLGLSDTDLERISGLFKHEMRDFERFKDEASVRIDYTYGYLYVADVAKTGTESVKIKINCREPFAVVSGTKDAIIDQNGVILALVSRNMSTDLIRIEGFDLREPRVNLPAAADTMDADMVSDALLVVKTIRDNNYSDIYTGVTMLGNREVRLTAKTGIPVIINLRFDVLRSLDLATGIMQKGVTKGGKIVVTGEMGYFDPDSGDAVIIRGM